MNNEKIEVDKGLLLELKAGIIKGVYDGDGLDGEEGTHILSRLNVLLGLPPSSCSDPFCPNCDGTGGALQNGACGVCWNWRGDEIWEHHATQPRAEKPYDTFSGRCEHCKAETLWGDAPHAEKCEWSANRKDRMCATREDKKHHALVNPLTLAQYAIEVAKGAVKTLDAEIIDMDQNDWLELGGGNTIK